jgi:hypothetical protein
MLFSKQLAQGRLHLPVAHTVTPHATKWRHHDHDCAVCTNTAAVSHHAVTHMAVNSDLVTFVLQVPGQVWAGPEWKRDNKLFIWHLAVCCQASLQHQVASIPVSIYFCCPTHTMIKQLQHFGLRAGILGALESQSFRILLVLALNHCFKHYVCVTEWYNNPAQILITNICTHNNIQAHMKDV